MIEAEEMWLEGKSGDKLQKNKELLTTKYQSI